MKVILLKDVKGVGKIHQVVDVKDGYAKNYLIRNKLAVVSTTQAQQTLDKDLNLLAQQEEIKIKAANELKSKLELINLEFTLKSNRDNVFGSVSHKMIIDELKDKYQVSIDKFMIGNHEMKTLSLGRHVLTINIYKQIKANLSINIREEQHGL
ncbi:MAG: 50S ribosomal protein L9 [Mycoplasmataceae bacterium]|jgi:large subunit ribosomal protein L9|nr:50S ribosomal protein L9 [Mycoplasmataceae bacterium]